MTMLMPSTWERWGVDANGDGVADPWNAQDAITSLERQGSVTEDGFASAEIGDDRTVTLGLVADTDEISASVVAPDPRYCARCG